MAFSMTRNQTQIQEQEQHTSGDRVNENFVYKLSLKDYILRLLILGSRENKYDQRKKNLSPADVEYIKTQIKEGHGEEICTLVREVYKENRAPKQDVTMTVMALLCRAEDIVIRRMGLQLLENFKTISHLYSWKKSHASIESHVTGQKSKGFGRAVKRQINDWILSYRGKPEDLAYQLTKYMAREGWSFKNIIQCTHVKTGSGDDRVFEEKEGSFKYKYKSKSKSKANQNNSPPTEFDLVLRYAVNGFEAMHSMATPNLLTTKVYKYLTAVHNAKQMASITEKEQLIALIYEHKLTREQIPTWGLADTNVLSALLVTKNKTRVAMPLTALLRNLGNLSAHSVLDDETIIQLVMKHLVHPDTIKFSKIHPVSVLTAWFTYRNGHGNHGHNTWSPDPRIIKTLEEMFYLSFKNIEPTGKRICFLIDCSGSMASPSLCEGVTCAESAALLAMIFARSETTAETSPDHSFYLFTSKSNVRCGTGLTDVSDVIDAKAEFDNVVSACQRSDWGSTDISMGILEALRYKRKYDAFVVITDNDVNSGIKPSEAMKQYRTGMKMPTTKLVVVATQGSDYTIADPMDPFMMDMVGFDAHGPKILQDFIRR
jgi:60 kDa SS-A/Ro ribonucleoprotein